MNCFFVKLFNFPTIFSIKLFPRINRMILRVNGTKLGSNIQVPGKVSWTIRGGKFPLEIISIFPLDMVSIR